MTKVFKQVNSDKDNSKVQIFIFLYGIKFYYLAILSQRISKKGKRIMIENTANIVKVRKNTDGDITNVMLDDGNVIPVEKAIKMAKEGAINGVNIGKAKNGREFLRSNPNDATDDNLENLPTF
jgi:hypothetical protein